jgi:hypothetical protein
MQRRVMMLRSSALAATAGLLRPGMAAAQADPDEPFSRALLGWSQPRVLYAGKGWTQYNALVASPGGKVHAFWQSDPSTGVEGVRGEHGADNVWYEQLGGSRAQKPTNVLTALPGGWITRSIRGVADQEDQLHLLFSSDALCLEHSYSRVETAASPHEWMANRSCIGDTSQRVGIARGAAGEIHLAYASIAGQVRYVKYLPAARRWLPAISVTNAQPDRLAADIGVAMDSTGRLHVVWAEYRPPVYYPPLGVYYAQSSDAGATWTSPRELATDRYAEPAIATIGANQVHITWNASAVAEGRFHKYSTDGGHTWSPAYQFSLPGGLMGPPALAVDSADRLHAVLSGSGFAYAHWSKAQGWSPLEYYWPKAQVGDPAAVISEGNRLHVLVRQDAARIIYLSRVLDAPRLEPEALAAPAAPAAPAVPARGGNGAEATPSSEASPPAASTPSQTDLATVVDDVELDVTRSQVPAALVPGVAAASLLAGLAVFAKARARF